MKKVLILAASFLLTLGAFAQAPQKMSYQAVIRNSNNNLVTGTAVGMKISVLQGSPNGLAVYVETQEPSTNANGLVSFEIGAGTVVTGSFSAIDWSDGPYFIQTETDPTGGTNYTITGTSQFLSVPYALYAERSGTPGPQGPTGPQGIAGNNGESAYELWLASGNTGTESEFLSGLVGAQGPVGNTGPIGPQGPDGLQGIQGPVGPQGATGADGLTAYEVWSAAGNTGTESEFLSSLVGPQGPIGNTGAVGPQGSQGLVGPQGATGADGLTAYEVWSAAGNTGTESEFLSSLVGPQGPIGNTGAVGPQGNQGLVGPQGATGADGLTAYEVWLAAGNTGTQAIFLASLVGPQGPIGNAGAAGPQGNQGLVGPQGPIGNTGAAGPQGSIGPMGATGPQGPAGPTNVVQSYCALANATTNSEVTIGGLKFRVNTNGTVEVMGVSTYLSVQVYSIFRTYNFAATNTSPSVFVNNTTYLPTEWRSIIESYNYGTSTYSPVNVAPLGMYTTYDCEVSALNTPPVTPTKSYRVHVVSDGYLNILLRVEYFQ